MRSDSTQLDVFDHSPRELAKVHRIAADTERHNPYYPEAERERRAAHYLKEAERLEAIAR